MKVLQVSFILEKVATNFMKTLMVFIMLNKILPNYHFKQQLITL